MKRKDGKKEGFHMDPLEQMTESLPEGPEVKDQGNRQPVDQKESEREDPRRSYSEQFKRL
ncbi:hypothetical protein [Melghirimyces algeriensis]|uniref:Uncharacterized protein n=1 Tax=Melghirimyces algeriensis TaxID=910412 RepID=A0A521DG44_9BACL|nr:hypothetical protein [Melghirimyces algeriensis]SMO70565.1 hypothetical protein SAMN06264849_10637 [Melghirimyces algeriensis]